MRNNIGQSFKIVGDWAKQSRKLKEKYPRLTSDDLKFEEGKEIELITRMGSRLHKKPIEIISIIKRGMPIKVY